MENDDFQKTLMRLCNRRSVSAASQNRNTPAKPRLAKKLENRLRCYTVGVFKALLFSAINNEISTFGPPFLVKSNRDLTD